MANSVVGLGLASPPVQLSNTVNAISQKFIVPVLGDNVFKPSPVFWALTREGKRFGAGELIFPEIYQEELPGGAYYGDQLLDTSVVDSVQPVSSPPITPAMPRAAASSAMTHISESSV